MKRDIVCSSLSTCDGSITAPHLHDERSSATFPSILTYTSMKLALQTFPWHALINP